MKVLWHTNIVLPIFAKELHQKVTVYGGWMTGLIESLNLDDEIELVVCFPNEDHKIHVGQIGHMIYYAIPQKIYHHQKKLEATYQSIFDHENPDILHIFGTEFPHTLTLVEAFHKPSQTIINLQGIVSEISKLYTYMLPPRVIKRYTLRDMIRRRNIYSQQLDFKKRGILEERAISKVDHVIGRTQFDHKLSREMNSNINYHHLNEILRPSFYERTWEINNVERYSILISQSHYPFKGLHMVIPEFAKIVKHYPSSMLYIAGKKPFDAQSLYTRLKVDSYGLYIKKLLKEYHISSHVIFLGELDELEMRQAFLNAHVFLSPSVIENESNAVSEAKILGVPTVSSFVGGVVSRIEHEKDGLFYPLSDPSQMGKHIKNIFDDDQFAQKLSLEAKRRAQILFNPKKNTEELKKIYRSIHK